MIHIPYDPSDWYLETEDDSRVWSTRRQIYVSRDDEDFHKWLTCGGWLKRQLLLPQQTAHQHQPMPIL